MVGILSDIGNYRKNNQDYVGYIEDDLRRIYIIADGMGGHNAGEVASKLAVDNVISYLTKFQKYDDMEKILTDAIRFCNKEIYEESTENPELRGMGTTVTVCLIVNGKAIVANVGDSRCYVLRDNGIFQITKDHSLVQQLIDNGTITESQAVNHPNKNIITRAVGTNINVEIDIFGINLDESKKIVLCTDGLSNEVTPEEMFNILNSYSNLEACRELIDLSKKKGSKDNISVIVFEGKCNNDR